MDIQIERSYPTPLSNSNFLPLLLLSLATQKHSPLTSSIIRDEYDYIIVGGGAAGSVVASRLSEESCVTVLLLEAGPEPPLLTEVPALSKYFIGSDLDWNFKTVPQKYASSAFKNNQVSYPTGKMLGGSAGFNGMAYVRGNKKDYDYWAELGASRWSYNDIFKYFLKIEDNRDPAFLADGYHATGGPITMEQPRYNPAIKQAVSEAAVKMGYQFVDSNGENQTGFYDLQANLRDNQRCSPVKGYLVPAERRNNLDISVNSFVTRLIIDGDQVTAVEFFNGKYQQVKAKKEVIMTAGSVNTPKILMLSGVGPREELEKFKIPLVADLPVGKNFHDHCGSTYYFTMDTNFRSVKEKIADPASIQEYIEKRSGPLSTTNNLLIAFLYGENAVSREDFPNYNLFLMEKDNSFFKKSGYKPEFYEAVFKPHEDKVIFRCASQVLHTRSRGTISLNSTNPFDPPLIDPNYLEDPGDLEDIVDGLKFCKKLLKTEPLLRLGAEPLEFVIPGCEIYVNDEEKYLRCYARTLLFNFNHHVGSTKMGDPSDPTTVVDPELRVKGIKNLRIADASVMPQVTSGANLIPVLVIAEKTSDMIKDSISCQTINNKK